MTEQWHWMMELLLQMNQIIDFLLYILIPIYALIIFHDILFENKWLSGPTNSIKNDRK